MRRNAGLLARLIAAATIAALLIALPGLGRPAGAATAPPTATAIAYRSQVSLDPDRHWLKAATIVSLQVGSATGQLTLLLNPALMIQALTVNGSPARFKRTDYQVTVELPAKAAAGDVVLVGVDYAGEVISQGWGLRGHIGNEGMFVSSEAWLPCDERWTAGLPSDLTVELPSGYTLVNLGQADRRENDSGRQRLHLKTSDLNIVAGVYDYRQIIAGASTVEVYTYAAYPEVGRILADEIPRAFAYLRRTLGDADIESLVIVNMPAVPGFGGGVAYDNLIGLVPDYRNARGNDIFSVLPHELTHRWQTARLNAFDGPGRMWLTEATAEYVGWLYLEDRFGDERFHDAMSQGAEVYWRDRLIDGTGSVIDFETNGRADLRYGAVYLKGAWALHMFRQLVGEQAFSTYLRTHLDWRAGSLDEWVGLCSRLAGFDVKPYFDEWLRGDGSQRLTVEGLTGTASGVGYQATYSLVAVGPPPKQVDIEFRTAAGDVRGSIAPTGARTEGSVALPEPATSVVVDPDRWLLLPPSDRPDLTTTGGDLMITYNPHQQSLSGTAILQLRNELGARPSFRLSLNTGLTLTGVTVRGQASQYIQSTRDLVITPVGGIQDGESFEVRLSYQGWPIATGAAKLPATGALPSTALWYPSLSDLAWPGSASITVPSGVTLAEVPGWQRQTVAGVVHLTRTATGSGQISLAPSTGIVIPYPVATGVGLAILGLVAIVSLRRIRRVRR